MAVTSSLAIWAVQSRDEARDQRREAEGLVGFMLGDLREKLEPIGRLDALDAVGSRALAYFQKQDKSELSDDALAQRSRALTLMGEIANTRGDLDGALRRYREAMASTGELARRYPDDPQRLFDHAQNVFWVGEIARQRGQVPEAEGALEEYKLLADQMVSLDPANRKWRMEVKYANTNLGVLLQEQRRYPEAAQRFRDSLTVIESLAAAEPANTDYQDSLIETLGWLSFAQYSQGKLDESIAKRERQVGLLERFMARSTNATYRQQAIAANRALGRLLASKGDLSSGLKYGRKAVSLAEQLVPTEPDNTDWIEYSAGARFDLARVLTAAGKFDEARAQTRAGCDEADRLRTLDSTVLEWRSLAADCLVQRSALALQDGANEEAMLLARQALDKARLVQARNDIEGRIATARAFKLIGDVQARAGNRTSAIRSWEDALATWPKGMPENPRETAIRMTLLKELGRSAEAKPLEQKLASMGYRRLI
jgi:tetratricopeptide (TPR) repeat protein